MKGERGGGGMNFMRMCVHVWVASALLSQSPTTV